MNAIMRLFGVALFSVVLTGCATNVVSDVTTFGHANVRTGSTVQVVAMDPAKAGSLEFKTYANLLGNGSAPNSHCLSSLSKANPYSP